MRLITIDWRLFAMKMSSFKSIYLVLAFAISLSGLASAMASSDFMAAVVSEQSLLLSDSEADSDQLGFLEAGDTLSVFPEMSTDDYFFVMASSGACEESYGWVPSKTVSFSDERYSDVPKNHWAQAAVRNLDDEGIMVGDNDGFNGEKLVSRYELATTLDRHLKRFEAYKNAVQASLEAIPVNKTLSASEATRMDRLIRHLEGIELTENSLKSSYAKLEERINNNEQRVDVVEEMSANNGELIAMVRTEVSGMSGKLANLGKVESNVATMMKRIGALERNQVAGGTNSPVNVIDGHELQKAIDVLSSRVKELESSRGMVMAKAVAVEPQAMLEVDDELSSEFSIDGFAENMDEEVSDINTFENPARNMSTNVTSAHSALRAALTKGLVIRRHPLDERASGVSNVNEKTGSEPNRVLVQALTKQIAAISSSLSSVGNRIEDIERGVL
jgi:prefoldin subunit 5